MICLALILATLSRISSPPTSIDGTPLTLTPLSLRYFPTSEHEILRNNLSNRKSKNPCKQGYSLPSLSELLLHKACTEPDKCGKGLYDRDSNSKEALAEDLYQRQLAANTAFYFQPDKAHSEDTLRRRSGTASTKTRMVHLTSATLIVLPINLLGQWHTEIYKHCDDRLRVLLLRKDDEIVPSAKRLANDYDVCAIVYTTCQRFALTII